MVPGRNVAAASCGFAAVVLAVIVPVAAGRVEPGYSHCSQFISELGAEGAVNARLVSVVGFAPIGALVLAFLAFVYGAVPGARKKAAGALSVAMVGVAYLIAAVFPCDAGCPSSGSTSQSIHNAFGLLEYAGALVGFVLLGSAFRASVRWHALFPACMVSALVVGAAFVAMLLPELASVRGLSQRVAETSIFAWIAVVSAFVLRVRP